MDPPKSLAERKAIRDRSSFFGNNPVAVKLINDIERVATKNTPILLEGETGTGKSLLARKIHELSQRSGQFISVNCATFSQHLLETELFGHAKGAFTGAKESRKGLVASAEHGTLFLDEIGELPLDFQPKLLHLLEEKTIRPVGSDTEYAASVRIIAATNQHLKERVKQGLFRPDLYYRLNVIPFTAPSLRDRPDDIKELSINFINQLCEEHKLSQPTISNESFSALKRHSWPGNIRELRNHIERSLLLDMPLHENLSEDEPAYTTNGARCLKTNEKTQILNAIDDSNGNKTKAASNLGISRRTLDRKLKRWKEEAA
jgi:transcriptional regulator with PAS, ATPase and Fis domain